MFLNFLKFDFDGSLNNVKTFALEIEKYCDTLKANGKFGKESMVEKATVNERYNSRNARSVLYGRNGVQDDNSRTIRGGDDGDVQPSQAQENPAINKNGDGGNDGNGDTPDGWAHHRLKIPRAATQRGWSGQ